MNKGEYIDNLYNEIKDKIELDIDVKSVKRLLDAKFEIDIIDSVEKWKYILKSYDLEKLSKDIDWFDILISFPNKIIIKRSIKRFSNYIKDIDISKKRYLLNNMFNIFNDDSSIFFILKEYIINNNSKQEKNFINYILSIQNIISGDIFDLTYFLKRVIMLHIENNEIDVKYFKELSELPNDYKNKAILKSLFLDYI